MVCALYEFFNHNVVLAGTAAGVFVGRSSFFDVGGTVDALASGQINGFDDDGEGKLRNRCIKIFAHLGRALLIVCTLLGDFHCNCLRCRYS